LTLWSWAKWGFLGLSLGSIVIAAILMWRAEEAGRLTPVLSAAEKTPRTHVDKPLIVERKAGRMIWRLKAAKAEQQLTGTMHLLAPRLELFTETDRSIPITGKEAWFEPLSKRIRFKGNVKVRYKEWRLFSDSVRYDHQQDTVRIPGPFRIQGKATRVRGKNLTAWRATRHIRVDGGIWIEDSRPMHAKIMP